MVDPSSDASAEVRKASKRLFGNADRLEVAAAVADAATGEIYEKHLAGVTGLDASRVGTQLRQLASVGLLKPLPKTSDRRQRYRRRESSYWKASTDLLGEFSRLASGGVPNGNEPEPPGGNGSSETPGAL
jgi:hypothetical protein